MAHNILSINQSDINIEDNATTQQEQTLPGDRVSPKNKELPGKKKTFPKNDKSLDTSEHVSLKMNRQLDRGVSAESNTVKSSQTSEEENEKSKMGTSSDKGPNNNRVNIDEDMGDDGFYFLQLLFV